MNFLKLLPLVILLSSTLSAQQGVSIGRPRPDNSAILHIDAPNNDKGVIFPYSSPKTIANIKRPSDGLFVYDSVFNRFAYRAIRGVGDSIWMYANPWDTEAVNINTTNNNADITSISTPYNVEINNDLSAEVLAGYGELPIGGIIMWNGPANQIPPNFELCDGGSRNGVTIPNLVGRFIRAGATAGATGGSDNVGTTTVNYEETEREIINGSDCQINQFSSFNASFQGLCLSSAGSDGTFDNQFTGTSTLSCEDAIQELIRSIPADIVCDFQATPPTCVPIPNPDWYLRPNSPCINPNARALQVVTSIDNKPLFYELAYIIRVE